MRHYGTTALWLEIIKGHQTQDPTWPDKSERALSSHAVFEEKDCEHGAGRPSYVR